MTTAEFKLALERAKNADLDHVDRDTCHRIFDGYGLEGFDEVECSIDQVAVLIRWQTFCFDGTIDKEALAELRRAAKKRFLITSYHDNRGLLPAQVD